MVHSRSHFRFWESIFVNLLAECFDVNVRGWMMILQCVREVSRTILVSSKYWHMLSKGSGYIYGFVVDHASAPNSMNGKNLPFEDGINAFFSYPWEEIMVELSWKLPSVGLELGTDASIKNVTRWMHLFYGWSDVDVILNELTSLSKTTIWISLELKFDAELFAWGRWRYLGEKLFCSRSFVWLIIDPLIARFMSPKLYRIVTHGSSISRSSTIISPLSFRVLAG